MKKKFFLMMLCGIIAFLFNFTSAQAQSVRLAEAYVPNVVNAMQLGLYKVYANHMIKENIVVREPARINANTYQSSFGKSADKVNGYIQFYVDRQNYINSVKIVALGRSDKDIERIGGITAVLLGALGMEESEWYNLMSRAEGDDDYGSTSSYVKSLNRYVDIQFIKNDSLNILISAHR